MSRRKAREAALQALFQLDFNEMERLDALNIVLDEGNAPQGEVREYAQRLIDGAQAHLTEIDGLISEKSREWKVERMSGVDRNIARIAVYEMRFGEESLAPNIVINEAVELAKRFGSDESPRFINGVLGALVRKN